MTRQHYRMRANEALVSGSAYLCAIVPLWGILVAWVIRESWRERSRHVVFHTTQAIWMQVVMLLGFIGYCGARLFCAVLWKVVPKTADLVDLGVFWLAMTFAAAYTVVCLVVAWMALDRRDVRLPLIGPRIHAQEYGDEE